MNGRRGVPKRSSRDTDGTSISRRAALAATAGLTVSTSGCLQRLRNLVTRDNIDQLSLTIITLPAESDRASIRIANELEQAFTAAGIDVSLDVRSASTSTGRCCTTTTLTSVSVATPAEPIPTTSTRRCTRAMPTNRAGRTHSATPTWPSTTSSRSNAAPRAMNDATLSQARSRRSRSNSRSFRSAYRGTPGRQNGSIHRLERKPPRDPSWLSRSRAVGGRRDASRHPHGCKTDGKPQSARGRLSRSRNDYRVALRLAGDGRSRWHRPPVARKIVGVGRGDDRYPTARRLRVSRRHVDNRQRHRIHVRVSQRHVPR